MLLSPMLQRLKNARDLQEVLHVGMHDLMSLLGAERGNVQLVGRDGELVVVAQHGLTARFLDAFRRVSTTSASVCGRAAAAGELVFVADVAEDAGFGQYLPVAHSEGITSILSCPLTTANDEWVGVVSAHFALRADPTPLERQSVGEYGEALARTVDHFLPRHGRVDAVEAMADALRGRIAATSAP
jgi:GAF domain-containing protein